MRILVLNCGSSSLKFTLFDMPTGEEIASGLIDRLGQPEVSVQWKSSGQEHRECVSVADHATAVAWVARNVILKSEGLPVAGVGHRIVHGGDTYGDSVVINETVEADIDALSALAPLHNQIHLEGIRAAHNAFPDIPQVAVFDTAFHQTLPAHAYRFPIPSSLYDSHGIRRYGFHGTSHRFVSERAAALLEIDSFTGVTCHLGNGSSLAAISRGHSIDTSMGLTPLGGIPMGTRSGDLDPAVVLHLQNQLGYTPARVENLLNKESGLLGLSGISNDLREIETAAEEGNESAALALTLFAYQVAKAIGGYLSILEKPVGIVFTGGIGENASEMRSRIINRMKGTSLSLDEAKNNEGGGRETDISRRKSELKVLVIPTQEELAIARDTYELIERDE
jgi:acetate kinase